MTTVEYVTLRVPLSDLKDVIYAANLVNIGNHGYAKLSQQVDQLLESMEVLKVMPLSREDEAA